MFPSSTRGTVTTHSQPRTQLNLFVGLLRGHRWFDRGFTTYSHDDDYLRVSYWPDIHHKVCIAPYSLWQFSLMNYFCLSYLFISRIRSDSNIRTSHSCSRRIRRCDFGFGFISLLVPSIYRLFRRSSLLWQTTDRNVDPMPSLIILMPLGVHHRDFTSFVPKYLPVRSNGLVQFRTESPNHVCHLPQIHTSLYSIPIPWSCGGSF